MVLLSQIVEIQCCLVVLRIGLSSDWINFSNTISWVVAIYAGFAGAVLFCCGYQLMMPCALIVDQYGGGSMGMGACVFSTFSVWICLLIGCLNVTK